MHWLHKFYIAISHGHGFYSNVFVVNGPLLCQLGRFIRAVAQSLVPGSSFAGRNTASVESMLVLVSKVGRFENGAFNSLMLLANMSFFRWMKSKQACFWFSLPTDENLLFGSTSNYGLQCLVETKTKAFDGRRDSFLTFHSAWGNCIH